ncbi:MAG TPA: hypothetical protein VIL00_18280 [Pseudonocardiaceae bacterium]
MREVYSQAPRCEVCRQRALLSEQVATRLVTATHGRLTAYRCPAGGGWHVVDPRIDAPGSLRF